MSGWIFDSSNKEPERPTCNWCFFPVFCEKKCLTLGTVHKLHYIKRGGRGFVLALCKSIAVEGGGQNLSKSCEVIYVLPISFPEIQSKDLITGQICLDPCSKCAINFLI